MKIQHLPRLLIALGLFWAAPLFADTAEPAIDPAIEERFRNLTSELRCVKCQNQTIYDSGAGVAEDLRRQVKEQINSGKTDEEIVDYMVARYGDFVRYRPPFNAETALLWVGPFLLLFTGITVLIIQVRKRRQQVVDTPLSDEERERVRTLLSGEAGDK